MAQQLTTRFLIIAIVLVALPTLAFAGQPTGRGVDPEPSTADAETVELQPWISSKVPDPVRKRIESSFELAQQRLSEISQCGDLFSNLGATGLEMLSSTLYFPASAANEKKLCRGAWGYTTVGAAPTFLCRKFSRISEKKGSMILIHEALHHAGMGEFPQDSSALTSVAINNLVEEACAL
jgi:hypothetical protein